MKEVEEIRRSEHVEFRFLPEGPGAVYVFYDNERAESVTIRIPQRSEVTSSFDIRMQIDAFHRFREMLDRFDAELLAEEKRQELKSNDR